MPVIRGADAPSFTPHGAHITVAAAPIRGATETCLWRVSLEPGSRTAARVLDREELFHALSGTLVATLDAERHVLYAGDTLVVPPGVTLSLAVPLEQPFEAICALPVGGRARFAAGGEPFSPPWAV
jgi:quercetin dioxygenase-like cupin family protein